MEFGAKIDYVLVGFARPSESGHVRVVSIVGDEPVNPTRPSDLATVLTELGP